MEEEEVDSKSQIYPDLSIYDYDSISQNTHKLYPNLDHFEDNKRKTETDTPNSYHLEYILLIILFALIGFFGAYFFYPTYTVERIAYNKNLLNWKKSQKNLNEHSWKVVNNTLYKHLFLNDLHISPIINAIGHPDNIREFFSGLEKFLYKTVGISKCYVIGRNSKQIKNGITLQNYLSSIMDYDPRSLDYLKVTRKSKIAGCILLEEPGELSEDTLKTLHVLVDDDRGLFPDLMIVLGLSSDGNELLDKSVAKNNYLRFQKRADIYYRRHINEKKSVFNAGDALIARLLANVIEV